MWRHSGLKWLVHCIFDWKVGGSSLISVIVLLKVAQSGFSVTVPFYFEKQEFHHKRCNSKLLVTVCTGLFMVEFLFVKVERYRHIKNLLEPP